MKEIFRVVIAGVDVPIYRATSKEIPELKNDDGEDLCGCFIDDKAHIYILQGQTKTLERDTINHEILHACLYFSGAHEYLKRCIKKTEDVTEVEETLVRVLTPHLHNIDWCK